MRSSKHHHELSEIDVGKCSVPIRWRGSVPAEFCDEPAYGKPEENQLRYNSYVPGLACYAHGGPKKPEVVEVPDE